ncbi:zinc ribbon domain-containing protein [Hoylesella timonensis]
MRKKFLSTLLMGALVTASMSTFTSCKDYDDDINNLQTQIDALTPLKTVKTELQSELANLQKQLEAKDAQLQEAITKLQTADADQTKQITKLAADVSGLEARVKTAEEALAKVNEALKGKASEAELKELAGKVAAVESSLVEHLKQIKELKAGLEDVKTAQEGIKSDIQEQKDALEAYKTRLEALEKKGVSEADLKKIYDKIEEATKALDKKLSEEISQLKADAKALSDKIDAVSTNVNVLNVLLPTELRSIVFAPDSYYWGIEATKIQTLKYNAYTLSPVAWNVKETKGYDKAERYEAKPGSRVLAFVANYHMNPSTAVIDPATAKVNVLSGDKEYTRAAAEAGLSVASWNVENGMLKVNLDVTNPEKIKNVDDDQMVTVFATQVTLPGMTLNKDQNLAERTITSDYATLYAESISDLKLAHRAGDDVPFLGVESPNKSVLAGPDKDHKHHQLLMQHAFEAGVSTTYGPQDSVNYNETLDLRKLVEVHYKNAKGVNRLMTAEELEANGMKYKFEITALYYGDNKTSESAHAAINPKDGYTFRPQLPEYDEKHIGKQQAYGADQARATIGRTPLVRVSLLDKDGKVLDYGYIRIKITEKKDPATIEPDKHVDYQGPDYNYSYNGECTDPATEWKYETKWIQTEYDLYHMLNITREEFEANYGTSPVKDANSGGGLQQYKLSANGKTFEKMAEPIGLAYNRNETSPEDGTLTSILGWKLTAAEAKKLFVTDKKGNVEIAVKYESKDRSKYPDVFVTFKTGKRIGTDSTPAGEVKLAENIISNYWYAANSSNPGTAEIHTNTLTPEDNAGGTADKMESTLGDVFKGNKIAAATLVNVVKDLTKNKEYAAGKLTLNVVFDAANNNKEFKGVDGKTYVMSISDDGKTLNAQIKGNQAKSPVATLTSPDDPSQTQVAYQHNEYAHALLNYKGHDELANDVIKAIIGIKAQNECAKDLALTNNTFDVRFLRPINAKDAAKVIEDANYTELQVIKAQDLLLFNDWRDAWNNKQNWGKGGAYATYYGITGVTIEGIEDGKSISENPDVKTNLGQSDPKKFVSLASVTKNIDFVYTAADGGTLTYKNLSSTVQEFQIKIPVTVNYLWGYITKDVTITVKKTANNAKKF